MGIDDFPCQYFATYTKLVEHLKLFAVNMPTESRQNGPAVLCVALTPDRIGATSALPPEPISHSSWRDRSMKPIAATSGRELKSAMCHFQADMYPGGML